MTQLVERPSSAATPVRPGAVSRSELVVACQQLLAIEALNLERRRAAADAAAAGGSREAQMDAHRRLDVVRRQHLALVERLDAQLRRPLGAAAAVAAPRVVLAHRNAWFAGKVSDALGAGVRVVACVDNGADAVGTALAEQPDLLLVEDRLSMVSGEDVVREVRRHCPDTLVAAQVDYGDRVSALVDAGADAVFTRKIPPADVATALWERLAG